MLVRAVSCPDRCGSPTRWATSARSELKIAGAQMLRDLQEFFTIQGAWYEGTQVVNQHPTRVVARNSGGKGQVLLTLGSGVPCGGTATVEYVGPYTRSGEGRRVGLRDDGNNSEVPAFSGRTAMREGITIGRTPLVALSGQALPSPTGTAESGPGDGQITVRLG